MQTQATRIKLQAFIADVARDADSKAGNIGDDADCSRWYFLRLCETFDIDCVARLELFAEGSISALTDAQVLRLALASVL